MYSWWLRATALLLLVVVAYVLIAPAFDLDPSANRAWRAALQMLAVIALLSSVLSEVLTPVMRILCILDEFRPEPPPSLLEHICVQQC